MRKYKSILLSLFIMPLFLLSIKDVFADACPPSGTGSSTGGASGIFGGGFYGMMNATEMGGIVAAIFILLLLFFVLLVFAMNKNKAAKSAPSYDQPPLSTTGGEARVQQPNGLMQTVNLRPGSNSIGRNPGSAIQLNDPKASGHHADLFVSDGRYTITDMNSSNGTYVNGEKITQRDLYQGDQVQIGDSRIIL